MNGGLIAGGPLARFRPPFVTGAYTTDSAADVVAIQQLLARYCHWLDSDTSDAQCIVELFASDGAVWPAYEGDTLHRGHEAIHAWYSRYLAASRSGSKLRRHLISSMRIEVEGSRGWAFSMLDAHGVQLAGNQLRFYAGAYEDDLVKVGGRWFFQQRRISLDYSWAAPAYELCRNGKQVWNGGVEQ